MDGPLVCGLLCLLFYLVASTPQWSPQDSSLTTDSQGSWENADVSTDVLPEVQLTRKSSLWNPVITEMSLRIRRQTDQKKKKKKRPNPGSYSLLSFWSREERREESREER